MSLIIDHSGRIAKRPTIKDLCANKAATLQQTVVTQRDMISIYIYIIYIYIFRFSCLIPPKKSSFSDGREP